MKSVNQNFFSGKTILWVVVGALVMYTFATLVVNDTLSTTSEALNQQLGAQKERLISIAQSAAGNSPDAYLQAVVSDCPGPDRDRFYRLLGKLNQAMLLADLEELESLFSRCGDYNAIHKSVVASRLEREIEAYVEIVSLYDQVLGNANGDNRQIVEWEKLATAERDESEAYAELVVLQKEIIVTLLGGATVDSPEIAEILSRVNTSQKKLGEANLTASELRTSLGVR